MSNTASNGIITTTFPQVPDARVAVNALDPRPPASVAASETRPPLARFTFEIRDGGALGVCWHAHAEYNPQFRGTRPAELPPHANFHSAHYAIMTAQVHVMHVPS